MDGFKAAAVKQRGRQAKHLKCWNMQKSELHLQQRTEKDVSNLQWQYCRMICAFGYQTSMDANGYSHHFKMLYPHESYRWERSARVIVHLFPSQLEWDCSPWSICWCHCHLTNSPMQNNSHYLPFLMPFQRLIKFHHHHQLRTITSTYFSAQI